MTPTNTVFPPDPLSPRVLIVDESPDNREVLRFALERRGVEVHEAGDVEPGLEFTRNGRPHLVILDLDLAGGQEEDTCYAFDEALRNQSGCLVILGKLHSPETLAFERQEIAKPYHFASLILRIEELLACT
jgi:DNA-binding response OmpR family regulator